MEDFLPSGLVPNADGLWTTSNTCRPRSGSRPRRRLVSTTTATNVDFLNDWKDLADERLKGKLLIWLPGDITAGGFLLGMADSLGRISTTRPDEGSDRLHGR